MVQSAQLGGEREGKSQRGGYGNGAMRDKRRAVVVPADCCLRVTEVVVVLESRLSAVLLLQAACESKGFVA